MRYAGQTGRFTASLRTASVAHLSFIAVKGNCSACGKRTRDGGSDVHMRDHGWCTFGSYMAWTN